MSRAADLARDRQVAELRAVLRTAADRDDEPDDDAVEVRTLDGFGDGFEPPRTAWRARLLGARGSVAVFVVVAVLTAAATAGVTWLMRPTATAVPAVGESGPASFGDERDDGPGAAPPATSSPASTPQQIVVAVVGQVMNPGLVTLTEGARVADAIEAAGGALPDADLSTVNLARKVADGEQIAVGVPGATDPGVPPNGPSGGGNVGPVNINTASAAQLDELPGVGPVIAQRIVDHRTANGPFSTVGELANVSGIGPAMMAKLTDLVTV